MTDGSSSIFLILIHLSFIFHRSHGYKVNQLPTQTVNPDGSAIISCEHDANGTSVDVRLHGLSPDNGCRVLCRKGQKDCKNVTMYKDAPNRWLFVLLHVGPEAMSMKYQCEFSVTLNYLDVEGRGSPLTSLLPGERDAAFVLHTPPPPQSHLLRWILAALLALVVLYSCIITCLYIHLRVTLYDQMYSGTDPENSTYVEMNAPRPRVHPLDIYCG